MGQNRASELAARIEIVADPLRLRIMAALRTGEMSVGRIAETLGEMPEAIACHVQALHTAGLLEERTDGRHSRYALPLGLVTGDGALIIDLELIRISLSNDRAE